ncbi:uncharacterized protein LOC120426853 [Culex pipiens pallens]|uniref:uncharacterized protein LOC120426853 n=1 Tax=Culex pipiens pallens TaxID=42434 RepID=UPI001954D666|nr:uncharacterized protein LOC120426853 [Culex pipiens pallens]
MGKEIDPADIGKHPDLIRKAQAEMTQSDVLVCGRCHNVFHFIELFREHKETECRKESTLKDCRETKSKVWAFLLWKSAQLNPTDGAAAVATAEGNVNSWKLYQTWVKLEESVRETWIVAGRTIQSFARMGQGSLQEMPVKITKTIIESGPEEKKATPSPVTSPTAGNRFLANRKPDYKPPASVTTTAAAKPEPEVKKVPVTTTTAVKKPEPVAKLPGKRSVAKRTTPGSGEVVEEEVEKILAKRFNPRRKEHEYLVKWTKFAHDANTWEPLIHLQTCQSVLEYFEVQLAKQKEQRAAAAARTLQQQQAEKAKAAGTTVTSTAAGTTQSATVVPVVTLAKTTTPVPVAAAAPTTQMVPLAQSSPLGGRIARNAKVNAMDKVKQWVTTGGGGGSSGYETESGIKRKFDSESGEFDGEEEEEVNGIKRIKAENGAAQIVARQGVKVTYASKSPVKIVNGVGGLKKEDDNAAEVIVKTVKDGTQSGVVKKPGFTSAKNVAGEAKIQIVNRGEVPKQGVFKVNAGTPSPQPSPAAAPTVNRTTPPGTTTTTTTRIVRKNIGGTQQLVKQVVRTTIPIQQAQQSQTQQQHGRQPLQKVVNNASPTGGAPIPKVTTNIVPRSSLSPKVGGPNQSKQPINRNIRSAPVSKNTTPEAKINALRKQGLNVVKRVISPAATSVEQKPHAHEEEEEEPGIADPFPAQISSQVPQSPPRALTLCPVTGKVLGQAEGEPTPVPSPEIKDDKKQEEQPQDTQVHQYLTNEDGSPIIVAGEDGTLYQVAGKNAEGQTILIAQGENGEQQCVLVASQEGEGEEGAGGVLTLDAAVSEAVAQIAVPQEGQQLTEEQAAQYKLQEGVDPNQQLTIQTGEDSQDGQITAEVVQADQPSPGGTRRVVLLLPDGSFMMTEVNEEQYQSLNLVN